MDTRSPAQRTWLLMIPAVAVNFLILLFQFMNQQSGWFVSISIVLAQMTFLMIGVVVLLRQPRIVFGWLFYSSAVLQSLGVLALEYAVYALEVHSGTLPGGNWAAWFGSWARGMGFIPLFTLALLFFPDGRLPSRRWRFALWLVIATFVFFSTASALSTASIDVRITTYHHPLQIPLDPQVSGDIQGVAFLLILFSIILCSLSVVARYRRLAGKERMQIKWLAFTSLLGMLIITLYMLFSLSVGTDGYGTGALAYSWGSIGIPAAVAIAILKHQLWDIDLIIRRTVLYTVLMLILSLFYSGSLVISQQVLRSLTGQWGNTEIAVVLSTLAVFVLFAPVRARLQTIIDQRFFRQRYNAERTLQTFAASVRDKVELERMIGQLISSVQETMQPESVTVWLTRIDKTPDQ